MARKGINKVTIVGNLGQDPEVRYMPSGGAVANISVATSETWKDKQTGEAKERVEWHKIVFYNKLAEIAGEYLKKGSQVYVEGSLRTRKWQDQSGQDRYTTEIVASEMQMLGGRAAGGMDPSYDQSYAGAAPAPQQTHQQAPPRPAAAPQPNVPPAPAAQGMDSFDDDIPFR